MKKLRLGIRSYVSDEVTAALQSFERESDDDFINEFVRPFAKKFLVSMVAMRIRLEKLGLLHREVPPQRTLAVGV